MLMKMHHLLTESEEKEIITLLENVYAKSTNGKLATIDDVSFNGIKLPKIHLYNIPSVT